MQVLSSPSQMELLGCRLLLEGYWDEGEHLLPGHEASLWLFRANPAVLQSADPALSLRPVTGCIRCPPGSTAECLRERRDASVLPTGWPRTERGRWKALSVSCTEESTPRRAVVPTRRSEAPARDQRDPGLSCVDRAHGAWCPKALQDDKLLHQQFR